jgi:hypothetical protein
MSINPQYGTQEFKDQVAELFHDNINWKPVLPLIESDVVKNGHLSQMAMDLIVPLD